MGGMGGGVKGRDFQLKLSPGGPRGVTGCMVTIVHTVLQVRKLLREHLTNRNATSILKFGVINSLSFLVSLFNLRKRFTKSKMHTERTCRAV